MLPQYTSIYCGIFNHGYTFVYPVHTLPITFAKDLQLRDVIVAVDAQHARWCECGGSLSRTTAWKADIVHGHDVETALEDYDPEPGSALAPSIAMCDIYEGTIPIDCVNIMLEIEGSSRRSGRTIKPIYAIRRLAGNVCRVRGDYERTFLPLDANYGSFVQAPGMHFIDRSEFITRLYGPSEPRRHRIPVLRSRSGFGKSTFLSMLTTYIDRSFSFGELPRPRTRTHIHFPSMFVLHLDFSHLTHTLRLGFSRDGLFEICEGFVSAAIRAFSDKYRTNIMALSTARSLGVNYTFPLTYAGLKILLSRLGCRLFVTVDNYTSPFIDIGIDDYNVVEAEIWMYILRPIFCSSGNVVWQGIITGVDVGYPNPFSRIAAFGEKTDDLSYSPEFATALGFSYQDVIDLGHAVLQSDLDAVLMSSTTDVISDLQRAVFSPKEVVSMIERVRDGDQSRVPISFFVPKLQAEEEVEREEDFEQDEDFELDEYEDPPSLRPSDSNDSVLSDHPTPPPTPKSLRASKDDQTDVEPAIFKSEDDY